MKTHPEIPKDHPRFQVAEGVFGEFMPARAKGWEMIDELTGFWRQDCAAHAAAHFFQKAETGKYLVDRHKAHKAAWKWLEWGKGE